MRTAHLDQWRKQVFGVTKIDAAFHKHIERVYFNTMKAHTLGGA